MNTLDELQKHAPVRVISLEAQVVIKAILVHC